MFRTYLKELISNQYPSSFAFSQKAGIASGHVSEILSGKKNCSPKMLDKILENLSLNEKEKDTLVKYWCFERTDGRLKDKYEKLEKENKNMIEVLGKVRKESELLEQINNMKSYEDFYNNIFKGLNSNESAQVIQAITERLKLIAIDRGVLEETKENFENLNKIIDKLNKNYK